jgi:hypothetical protein
MNTAQRAALLVGGIIALVALLVAAVVPVSASGFGCGSALLADDDDYTLAPMAPIPDDLPELQRRQVQLEELSAAAGDKCATARRSRLLLTAVGVIAGGALMAGGGALFRDRVRDLR